MSRNETYIIVPEADVKLEWFDEMWVRQNESSDCRQSLDGSECIIKLEEDSPIIASMIPYIRHTHEQIVVIINDQSNGWLDDPPGWADE